MAAVVSPAGTGFADRYRDVRSACSGDLAALKERAWEHFEALGIPGRKVEAWRDLNLNTLEEAFAQAANPKPRQRPATSGYAPQGECVLALPGAVGATLPAGVSLTPVTGDALPPGMGALAGTEDHPFNALNTALFAEADILRIGGVQEQAIHVVHGSAQSDGVVSVHPRLLVEVEEGAECILIEEFPRAGAETFLNPVTEVSLGAGSRLTHHRLVAGGGGWHIGSVAVGVDRDAVYRGYSLALEGELLRVDLNVALRGPGAETQLFGVFAADDAQAVDHHTHIQHAVRDTTSRQLYRGILGGKSRGVFNGRIVIDPGAQRVSADQVNNNLLLSNKALMNSNPQLEIFADDVSCRHGATIGQLDESKVFYLRSRGLDRDTARALLTQAFLDEVLEDIQPESLKEFVQNNVRERFFAGV